MCGITAVLLSAADATKSLDALLTAAVSFAPSRSPPPLGLSAKSVPKGVSARELAVYAAKHIVHRGPDWSGTWPKSDPAFVLPSAASAVPPAHVADPPDTLAFAHTRLAIIRPETGSQPLLRYYAEPATLATASTTPTTAHPLPHAPVQLATCLAVNGEIYNYIQLLRDELGLTTSDVRSDCEVISMLWEKYRDFPRVLDLLDGDFAFVLYDAISNTVMVGRDRMGVCPAYIARTPGGSYLVASELKAIYMFASSIQQVSPGACMTLAQRDASAPHAAWEIISDRALGRWPAVTPAFLADPILPAFSHDNTPHVLGRVRQILIDAVKKRMMCDVPYGVLLSGGLDSSLVASIAARVARESEASFPQLHSFSIGLQGSPDHAAARKVAEFIGTKHHEFIFTVQDGLDAIADVIYQIETFDVTTIRASTPMYLLSRLIKALGVKMVLSGEGADEVFGGYLYFHHAPNAKEFHEECVRKIELLNHYDVLRANKSSMSWGLEVRVPFLDKYLLAYMMQEWLADWKLIKGTDHLGRKRIEKHVLRSAFDTPNDPYLPDSILWRQKEQFSDGVGYTWIDGLVDFANLNVSDADFAKRFELYPKMTPLTKEAFLYRRIFEQRFPSKAAVDAVFTEPSIACSSAKALEWNESFKNRTDPSGRAMHEVHSGNARLKS